MAEVICNKCGATGSSKNPMYRNVFPDDQVVSMAGCFMQYPKQDTKDKFTIIFNLLRSDDKDDPPEIRAMHAIQDIFKWVAEHNTKIEQVFCNHNWEFAPGETSDI